MHKTHICFTKDGPEAAARIAKKLENRPKSKFPFHSNATLGPADKANDRILMMPDGPLYFNVETILTQLRVLRQTHLFYADLEILTRDELTRSPRSTSSYWIRRRRSMTT